MAAAQTELAILVRLKDQLSKEIKNAGTATQKFGRTSSSVFSNLARSIKSLVTGPLAALTAGISGLLLIRKATREYSDFAMAMAEVSTLVDTSVVSMDMLTKGVLELSKAHGGHETIVAKGLYQTISADIQAGAVSMRFLEQASKLAVAGVSTTEEAVKLLAATVNAFKAPLSEVEQVSDVLFKTVRKGTVTIPELAASLSQAAPVAYELGVSLEEMTAAVAALTLGGAPVSEAFTNVSAIMNALLKQTEDVNDLFQRELGESFSLATLRADGLLVTIEKLAKAADGDRLALARLVVRQEAIRALFALTGSAADNFRESLEYFNDRTAPETEQAFRKQMENPAKRVQVMFNALRIEMLELGRIIIDKLVVAIDRAGGIKKLGEDARLLATVIGELAGVGIVQMGNLIGKFHDLLDAAGGVKRATEIIKAGIDVIAAAIDLAFEKVALDVERLIRVIASVPEFVDAAIRGVDPFASSAAQLHQELQRLHKNIEDMWSLYYELGHAERPEEPLAVRARRWIEEYEAQAAAIKKQLEDLPPSLDQVRTKIEELQDASTDPEVIKRVKALTAAWSDFTGLFEQRGTSLKDWADSAKEGFKRLIDRGRQLIGVMNELAIAHARASAGAGGPAERGPRQPREGFAQVPLEEFWGKITGGINTAREALGKFFDDFWEKVGKARIAKEIKDNIAVFRAADSLLMRGTDAITDFASGARNAKDAFRDFAKQFLTDMLRMIVQAQLLKAIMASLGWFGISQGAIDKFFNVSSEKGNVFSGGGVVPFQHGGVVSRPTMFPLGTMAEKAPEAIMPLRRTTTGRLGVEAVGGSGGEVHLHIGFLDTEGADGWLLRRSEILVGIMRDAMYSDPGMRASFGQ